MLIYLANRLLAFNIANSISGFLATGVAFWRLANWIANSVALGVIAFPSALGVALR